MNTKAVSPLIATVLLIAFSIALAAVVFTYIPTFLDACSEVSVEIGMIDGHYDVCLDNDNVYVTLENTGRTPISHFKATIHGSGNVENADLEEILSLSESIRYTIPFNRTTTGSIDMVRISPLIFHKEEMIACSKSKSIEIIDIPRC